MGPISHGKVLLGGVTSATFGICTAAFAGGLLEGAYETDFGTVAMTCAEDRMCFGSYEDGLSSIYIARGGVDEAFTGYWAEPDSNESCNETVAFPNIQTAAWGRVSLVPSPDGSTWSGHWGYCDAIPETQFSGALAAPASGSSDASVPVGGDASVRSRILGSWIPTPDSAARRNDVYTFNPDGSSAITDGSGMNILRTWDLQRSTLLLDGVPVPFGFAGNNLVFSDVEHERFRLWEDAANTSVFSLGFDPYGRYVPLPTDSDGPVAVGDYALKNILLGQPEDFGPNPQYGPPIIVEFWNETEEIKRAKSGNAYRDDTVSFEIYTYEITENIFAFAGAHPEWGELYFEGTILPDAGHFAGPAGHVLQGDLMVKGHIFRFLEFAHEFLD